MKIEIIFQVDIPSQDKYDANFYFDMVPFEVGRQRHGRDGRGQADLTNIVADLRERVLRHMRIKGEQGSDIIFKRVLQMDIRIVPSQVGRRLQPRRHMV